MLTLDNRDFEEGNNLNPCSQNSDHKKVEREKSLGIQQKIILFGTMIGPLFKC